MKIRIRRRPIKNALYVIPESAEHYDWDNENKKHTLTLRQHFWLWWTLEIRYPKPTALTHLTNKEV